MTQERTATIKYRARQLGEQFKDRHDAGLVDQYTQFSLGVMALTRDAGTEPDRFSVMRGSAKIAVSNVCPDQSPAAETSLTGDEELTGTILTIDDELISA
ncbi:MAG: hypothetical protein ACXWLH_00795 [Candidatus Saccharimonadales bacterium]